MNRYLKYTMLAGAIAQAFIANAQAQDTTHPVAEVVVTGNRFIVVDRASVGGFGEASLFDTPASITAIGRTQMQDLSIRSTTEAMRFDASVADAYNAVGQPQKALDIMKDLDETQATPYGRMAAAETRVCAYAQLQDKRRVDDLMAYMRAHAADGPDAMRTALICTDDQEGLAAVYLKQLDDPDLRGEALGEAQAYIEPAHQTPYEARMRAALHRMLARPDVRAAIAKYGFVNSYPLVR
mgnify:CR=1 FL=1